MSLTDQTKKPPFLSTTLRWCDAEGAVHTERTTRNPRTNGIHTWKVIMLKARWAECLDDHGNVTARYTREEFLS